MKESDGLRTQVEILESNQENFDQKDIQTVNIEKTKNNSHFLSDEMQKIQKRNSYYDDSKDEEDLSGRDKNANNGFGFRSEQRNNNILHNLESYPSSDGDMDDGSDRNSPENDFGDRTDSDGRLFLAVAGTLEAVSVFSRISSKQSRYETSLLLASRKSLLMHGRTMTIEGGRIRGREGGSDCLPSNWKHEDIDGYYHVGMDSMLLASPVQVEINDYSRRVKTEGKTDSCMNLCNDQSPFISLSLSLSHSLSPSLSLPLYVSLSHSLSLSLPLSLLLSLSLSLSLTNKNTLTLSPPPNLSPTLSLSLTHYLSHSFSLSNSHTHTHTHTLSFSLSPCLHWHILHHDQ